MKLKESMLNLIVFSLVPISQILLFLSASDRTNNLPKIINLKQSLNMSANQVTVFEIFITIIYSILSFMMMYIIYLLAIKLSAQKNAQSLYIALILAVGISNSIGIVCNLLSLSISLVSVVTLFLQVIILAIAYAYDSKDYKGAGILVIVAVLINTVIPSII